MSDSLIAFQPAIEEPSNIRPFGEDVLVDHADVEGHVLPLAARIGEAEVAALAGADADRLLDVETKILPSPMRPVRAANGPARCSSPSRRPAPTSARCAPAPSAQRRRQLSHHRPEDLHHLRRARSHRQHRPPRAGAPARCAARHRGISLFLVPKFLSTPTARSARNDVAAFDRAQARHPRLADLHHGLRRQRRRDRLAVGEENRGSPACSR
jgi:hypothetical protein